MGWPGRGEICILHSLFLSLGWAFFGIDVAQHSLGVFCVFKTWTDQELEC